MLVAARNSKQRCGTGVARVPLHFPPWRSHAQRRRRRRAGGSPPAPARHGSVIRPCSSWPRRCLPRRPCCSPTRARSPSCSTTGRSSSTGRALTRTRSSIPHNEHIVVAPVLIYKALLELFGMDSARPFQVASTATFLASAVLLFVWLRRRAGDCVRARRDRARALFRRRVGGPAVAVSDRLLRLDGDRARGADRASGGRTAAATSSPARCWSSASPSPASAIPFAVGAAVAIDHRPALALAGLCRRRPGGAVRALVPGLGAHGREPRLAREPRRDPQVRLRQHRRRDLVAVRARDAARRVGGRRARLGPAAGGAGAGAGGGPHLPPRPGAALALGRRRDRALLLGARRLQPEPGPRCDREPLPVRRAGSCCS